MRRARRASASCTATSASAISWSTTGRITAILDWELVRLGDPVEDLGWICMQAWRGRSPYMCHLFEREELIDRYNAVDGFRS